MEQVKLPSKVKIPLITAISLRIQFRDIPTQLDLKPIPGNISYALAVSQIIKIRDAKPQKTTTQWDINIKYNQSVAQGLSYSIQFSDAIYNGSKDYSKLEWLYARIFRVFRKLDVIVNLTGSIHSIVNKEEVIANWNEAKKHIIKLYKDENVDELILKTEDLVYNKLEESLKADPLFNFLFNDIYLKYGEKRTQTLEKQLTGHFGSIPYPILENKKLETSTNNDLLAIVNVETDLQFEKWPSKNIDHYLGKLIGDLKTTDYLYSRKGSYLIDFKACQIMEATMEVIGKIPGVYNKTTSYKLKQKQ